MYNKLCIITTLRECRASGPHSSPFPLVCPPQAVRVTPRHTPPAGAFLKPAARCLLLTVFLHTSLFWESSTFLLSQQQLWPTLQSVSSCSRSTDTLRPRKAYANLIFTLLKQCKLANTSIELCCQL